MAKFVTIDNHLILFNIVLPSYYALSIFNFFFLFFNKMSDAVTLCDLPDISLASARAHRIEICCWSMFRQSIRAHEPTGGHCTIQGLLHCQPMDQSYTLEHPSKIWPGQEVSSEKWCVLVYGTCNLCTFVMNNHIRKSHQLSHVGVNSSYLDSTKLPL